MSLSQCVYCGCNLLQPTLELDHVIPLCRGGADVAKNKAPCCVPCNRLKGPFTAREFIEGRDDPSYLEALKRQVLRELDATRDNPPPLPAVPPVPPPRHARSRPFEATACIAHLGFKCHCPICAPDAFRITTQPSPKKVQDAV